MKNIPNHAVVDLFCGVGGLTYGLKQSGLNVAAGIDCVADCGYAFTTNNKARFVCRDILEFTADELNNLFVGNKYKILAGCAPCQPFSNYSKRYQKDQRNKDAKWRLLYTFSDFIEHIKPEIVSMENVPGLLKEKVFDDFCSVLLRLGYSVKYQIVFAPDYGVPQNRRRLVLLASLLGKINLIEPNIKTYLTVRDAIGNLEPLEAGECSKLDILHRCSKLSELNLRRIRASKVGGTWRDWEPALLLDCHQKKTGKSYPSVYGRMSWNEPAPTITTQFYGLGNGRFGHPEQDRALSLREGALLQSFPCNYEFVPAGQFLGFKKIGRMIGNAVPPAIGLAIGKSIVQHLKDFGK